MSEIRDKISKIVYQKCSDKPIDQNRVNQELQYLEDYGLLQDMFLLYQKIEKGTHKPGNINKMNCLVGYCLGITTQNCDPSKPFEVMPRRTYGRAGFPDIDMDFDYEKRHLIVEYLINKYGRDYVGNIGTKQTLKTKAALRRVIKILDPDNNIMFDSKGNKIKQEGSSDNFKLEQAILSTLPGLMKRADGSFVDSVEASYKEYSEFRKYMDQYPEVRRIASVMEGGISAFGCHAAGMLISPVPLEYICPLHMTRGEADGEKTIATQFTMSDVESLGLIKFDVLGLSTKTAIAAAVKTIKERHGIDIDLANLPLNDKKTLELIDSGKTDGCFQLENPGMKQTLQQIGIDSFDDLVVAIAMFRPGPKDYIPELAKRKKGITKVSYPHPIMQKITSKTYGIMAYQEQVMQVFMAMASLTASDGYKFMKGCAKKKPELIEASKEQFFRGALNNKIDKAILEKVWHDMEKFGGYAFNKSHAVSYAYESLKTAYLKAHFPVEFIAARLTVENDRRNFEDVLKYEHDAIANYGMKILPPDLNKSKMYYAILGENEILKPFISKGIGPKAAEDIIKHQPYKGPDRFYSFATKVGSSVSTAVIEAMVDLGIWSDLKKPKTKILAAFEQIKKDVKMSRGRPMGDMFE